MFVRKGVEIQTDGPLYYLENKILILGNGNNDSLLLNETRQHQKLSSERCINGETTV